jgi:hypothetical protein
MVGHYHNGMDLLTAKDIGRIYLATDHLQLHRDWVVVPLNCAAQSFESVMPDGKLLLRPPGGDLLDPWIDGLEARLSALDLSRVARLGAQAAPSTCTPLYPEDRAGQNIGRTPTL